MSDSPKGDPSTQYQEAMIRLKGCARESWKEMRRQFRQFDPSGAGYVEALDFRQVLRNSGANLSENEFFHLMNYYDTAMDGRVNYNDFLRGLLQGNS